jgi:hypothetical protein
LTPGLTKRQTRRKPGFRDVAGLAQQRDFRVRLDGAQAVHQRGQAAVFVERIAFLHVLDEARVAALHHHLRALVLVGIEKDLRALAHQPVEQAGEIRQPFHPLHPGNFPRLLPGQLVALPGFQQRIGLAQEQDLALLGSWAPGYKQQQAFLLLDACQIKQVGILLERQNGVAVERENIIGIDRRQRIGAAAISSNWPGSAGTIPC